ncbi:MAG: phospholipid carrier-dependent glycosyltransferase [Flavobacteriia bacterium]|nr:phospholipid carrier-dependent glycosyltransferase [Flavobacteriia bacterium]
MAKKNESKKANTSSIMNAAWAPYALLSLLWLIVFAVTFDTKIDLGGDNAAYYILGDSIASGKGYTNAHVVGEVPNNHFPPGYPLILSFFMMFSSSIGFLKVITGLFFLGTVLLSFRIFDIITENSRMALVVAIFILLNGNMIQYGNIMMSEVPFMFFATLTLLWFMKSEQNDNFLKDWRFWAMIAVALFSFHIRTAGIALIGALLLYLLFNKKWLKFGVFAGSFVALATPWILRGRSIGKGGGGYINQLLSVNPYRKEEGIVGIGDLITRMTYNIERYISVEIPRTFFAQIEVNYSIYMRWLTGSENVPENYVPETHWLLGLLLLGLVVFGVFKLKKYRSFVAIYMLGSAAILLLWPHVWFGTRFIMPLIPFLLLGAVLGVDGILRATKIIKDPNPLIYLVFVIALAGGVQQEKDKVDAVYPNKYGDFLKMADFVDDNLPEDAIVVNRKPGLFYLYANRQSIGVPSTFDYEEIEARFDSAGVTHIIIDAMGFADVSRYLVPYIQDNKEKFGQLHVIQSPDVYPTILLVYFPERGYSGEWEVIEGEQVVRQRTGKGVYRFSDGRIFDGYWKNGIREGEGIMRFRDGKKLIGSWKNDSLFGNATLLNVTGDTLLYGTFVEEEIPSLLEESTEQ